MGVEAMHVRKWVVLGATLVTMLAASLVFGENPTPCQEAYRTSGLTPQQMGFEEFRDFYGDSVCATGGPE
jgi:hypothetical protein